MRRIARCIFLAVAGGTLAGAGCPEDDPITPSPSAEGVLLSITQFRANTPSEGHYELWISFADPDRWISAGKFRAGGIGEAIALDGTPAEFAISAEHPDVPGESSVEWEQARRVAVTVEPPGDSNDSPNLAPLLAGDVVGGGADLSVEHASAIGASFAFASGSFVLETPTTPGDDLDEDQGVWFATPGGAAGSLQLPVLGGGWLYQAWASDPTAELVPLGPFADPFAPDLDGAGPLATVPGTDGPGYEFPGSDFPFGQVGISLANGSIFIALEPPGDADGTTAFFVQVLGASIQDQAPAVAVPMENRSAITFPSASATLGASARSRAGRASATFEATTSEH